MIVGGTGGFLVTLESNISNIKKKYPVKSVSKNRESGKEYENGENSWGDSSVYFLEDTKNGSNQIKYCSKNSKYKIHNGRMNDWGNRIEN